MEDTLPKRLKKLAAPDPARRRPVRARGKFSRARLIEAAKCVFARLGYLDTRVADIANEADVAHGTFYTYFDSKEEILRYVADDVFNEMFAALEGAEATDDLRQLVIDANRRYVELYERNLAMIAVIEQVATFNDDFRQMRLAFRRQHEAHIARVIRRAQGEATDVSPQSGIDPAIGAGALGGMVDNFLYHWLVLKQPFEREAALATLNRIWLRALELEA